MEHKVDVKVMACECRMDYVRKTYYERLHISDSDVSVDTNFNGCVWNSRNAFCMPNEDGITHRCVIQDDIDFVDDLRDFMDYLVGLDPDCVWSLMADTKLPKDAHDTIFILNKWTSGQAVILPLKYQQDFKLFSEEFCRNYMHQNKRMPTYDDRLMSIFCAENGIRIRIPVPFVVSHEMETAESSIMRHDTLYFSRPDISRLAMERDWTLSDKVIGTKGGKDGVFMEWKGKIINV